MTQPTPEPSREDAQSLFDDWRHRRVSGESVDLEEYCGKHPDLANALRALHSLDIAKDTLTRDPAEKKFEEQVSRLRATEVEIEGSLRPGEAVGPYKILNVLGEGGFAIVYRAEQSSPVRRDVALKAIKPGLDTRQVLLRFEAERQALAVMSHGSIAKIYDAGTTKIGRPYFVMELVDGHPITEYCDSEQLDTRARLELFLEVCDAIQHAHQKAIIHRDLKPANVLVTREGQRAVPKVIDFGIAKALGEQLTDATMETEIGQIIGTPAYMSPEQAEGDSAGIDTRTDIYALGVLLYELLSGQKPFDFRSLKPSGLPELQRIIREVDPPAPSTRVRRRDEAADSAARCRKSTPPALSKILRGDLDWITGKALAKDPAARYSSASEFAQDIRRHLNMQPVLAGPPSLRYRTGKLLARHRRLCLSALVAFVSIALSALAVDYLNEQTRIREAIELSDRFLGEGKAFAASASGLRQRSIEAEQQLRETRDRLKTWQPVWERSAEILARGEWQELRDALEEENARIFVAYSRALHSAPLESPSARRATLELNHLDEELRAFGSSLSPGRILLIERAGDAPLDKTIRGSVEIQSEPSGADVYCFKYEEHETRLLPLPFSLSRGKIVGEPQLVVARIWDSERARALAEDGSEYRFRSGDRWLRIAGREVTTRGDIASVISGLEEDEPLALRIETGIARTDRIVRNLRWIPFPRGAETPPFTPGRLIDIRRQLGITFAGYPLECSEFNLLGTTGSRPIRVELPAGSYLLVLAKPGYVDVRLPLISPRDFHETVQLLRPESIPEGFVQVPASTFRLGGSDQDLLQNMPYSEERLDAFFIAQLETCLGEYLEFVRARSDPKNDKPGFCAPKSKETLREAGNDKPIRIIPTIGRERRRDLIFVKNEKWELDAGEETDGPVQGISYLAMLEFAHWKTEQDPAGWKFRLATDREWEKAARGADWRTFVWGDYMIWSFSLNSRSVLKKAFPNYRGGHPFDESVYGVLDLSGSVVEFAAGRPVERKAFRSCRGGGWTKFNAYRFRTDARYGLLPTATRTSCGIRLVAERKTR